jgi:serine/threonine protein kinase
LNNIALDGDYIPYLINFSSAHFGDDEPKRRCGMKGFIAPEIANDNVDINSVDLKCSDMWSFGALMSLAVFRRLPYDLDTDWSKTH